LNKATATSQYREKDKDFKGIVPNSLVGQLNPFSIKANPTHQEAESILAEAVSKRFFLILVAKCRVDYMGRSSSTLDWGERVVMIKPDRSVLVHRKKGYEPTNWQPAGAILTFSTQNDKLTIRANRRSPRESLMVTAADVMLVSSFSLKDDAIFNMSLTEEDIYRVLLVHPNLIEDGFRISSQQKEFESGKADLVGYDKDGRYTVVEVKRVAANKSAVKQLFKYVSRMRVTSPDTRAILVAPSIQPAARRLSATLSIEFSQIDLRRCVELLSKEPYSETESIDRHLNK
jgi:RecB family endonuclease NucS